jgi:predicted membrane protein
MLIALGSISYVIFTAIGAYGPGTGTSAIEVFRSVAIALAVLLGIVGIIQEKLWAKWFAIIAYGLYIFGAIEGIVNSFLTETALKLFINPNTLIALRLGRLIAIVLLLVGVVLLLKKPRPEDNVRERG